eukprot:gb/GFBE01008213.1/.p1 GENE.gb/GFBE01008213.1/~~gb/GFBE01008213.1/.p1  ORF type:complete len:324 (+),score=56.50 gb/GFBE01008213.1/:1-972(+)
MAGPDVNADSYDREALIHHYHYQAHLWQQAYAFLWSHLGVVMGMVPAVSMYQTSFAAASTWHCDQQSSAWTTPFSAPPRHDPGSCAGPTPTTQSAPLHDDDLVDEGELHVRRGAFELFCSIPGDDVIICPDEVAPRAAHAKPGLEAATLQREVVDDDDAAMLEHCLICVVEGDYDFSVCWNAPGMGQIQYVMRESAAAVRQTPVATPSAESTARNNYRNSMPRADKMENLPRDFNRDHFMQKYVHSALWEQASALTDEELMLLGTCQKETDLEFWADMQAYAGHVRPRRWSGIELFGRATWSNMEHLYDWLGREDASASSGTS